MIEYRDGDIFNQTDLDYIVHQCNLYHVFGSGIAKIIRQKFPWAYEADCHTRRSDRDKLGTYKLANAPSTRVPISGIFNMYSQDGISSTERTTNYAAMGRALWDIEKELVQFKKSQFYPLESLVLGIPHKIGCGLAGGDWSIVLPIIQSVFENSAIKSVICKKV